MSQRPQSRIFKIYVLAVCTAWLGVLVAALWGLDWRWIPTTLVAAVILLVLGGLVENWLHDRAQRREFLRQLDEAKGKPAVWLPPAEEVTWLGSPDQPR